MKAMKFLKNNLFLVLVVLGYLALAAFSPSMGLAAVKNSGYYIKEMIMIMPVIFVLTALLDAWVPRETILKYLGDSSKVLGAIFALALGSISAGPVYAAFPVCVVLLKKGASVRNIVIILSSWAVIKIPMLLNEVKFLGPKFMALRWVLTVIAIVVLAWLTDRLVKKEHLSLAQEDHAGLRVNKSACMGCGLCARTCPEAFEMQGKKAMVRETPGKIDAEQLAEAVARCPVKAISND